MSQDVPASALTNLTAIIKSNHRENVFKKAVTLPPSFPNHHSFLHITFLHNLLPFSINPIMAIDDWIRKMKSNEKILDHSASTIELEQGSGEKCRNLVTDGKRAVRIAVIPLDVLFSKLVPGRACG